MSKTQRGASGVSAAEPELRLDAPTLRRAAALADQYTILVEPNTTAAGKGWYLARALEVPTAFANARSPGEAFDALKRSLVTVLGAMIQEGVEPPAPASDLKREHQMNIRLTTLEKVRLEAAASQAGFRSVSDFVRASALKNAG